MKNTLERRLKLLKMEGVGFSRNEIVSTLANEYDVTERTLRRDFESRGFWQPLIQEMDPQKSLLQSLNRDEQIYRKASLISLQSHNDNARVGALKLMLDTNKHLLDLTNPKGINAPTDLNIHVKWLDDVAYIHQLLKEDGVTEDEITLLEKAQSLLYKYQRIKKGDSTRT